MRMFTRINNLTSADPHICIITPSKSWVHHDHTDDCTDPGFPPTTQPLPVTVILTLKLTLTMTLNSSQRNYSHPQVANTRKEAQCELMYIPDS